jgi:hypothetical protein
VGAVVVVGLTKVLGKGEGGGAVNAASGLFITARGVDPFKTRKAKASKAPDPRPMMILVSRVRGSKLSVPIQRIRPATFKILFVEGSSCTQFLVFSSRTKFRSGKEIFALSTDIITDINHFE